MVARHSRERSDICDVSGRVTDALAEYRPRIAINYLFDVAGLVAFSKAGFDPELGQKMGKHRMRRPIKLGHGDEVPPWLREIGNGVVKRRLPGTDSKRLDATFERRHPTFQHSVSGVADAAVAIAFDFKIEQGRAMRRIVETIRHGLINRYCNRACCRIHIKPGMERKGVTEH